MRQGYYLFLLFCCYPFISFANPDHRAVEFVENKGQWKEPFLFKSRTPNCDIYIESNGFTFAIGDPQNAIKMHEYQHGQTSTPPTLNFHAYKITFDGALKPEAVTGNKAQQHYYNYYLGNDPTRWKTGLHPYHAVDYKSIYAGIDMHIASEAGQVKYDFLVSPGADADVIKLRYDGIDGLSVVDGKLMVRTSLGNVIEQAPYAYQLIDGERREVSCKYRVRDNFVTYIFPNGYDHSQLLVIDPTMIFTTFTGSSADNFGFTATFDNQGNLYAGGFAVANGYPVLGAYQATYGGGSGGTPTDIAISKFNATGTALIYSTYLGGKSNEQPHSMVVDNAGNLTVVGRTYSDNFPVLNAYDATYNHIGGSPTADIIVTKFNSAGSALIGSTYIGGSNDDGVNISNIPNTVGSLKHNFGDDGRSEVITDNAGNIYVAASTKSTDFPTQSGGGHRGLQDGVVFKLNNNLSALLWSNHIGGTDDDACYVLALDKTESKIFVSGGTLSNGMSTGSVYQNGRQGDIDGYIARFQNGGTYPLERLTYIGTSAYDQCYGIQIDDQNNVYTMGQSNGNFPVINAAYSNTGANQFVMKLNNDLSTVIYSTVFGSVNANVPNISPVAFLVDTCQQVYISGWGSDDFPGEKGNTNGMPVLMGATPPALLKSTTDGDDFYFIALGRNASGLLFAGFYGGSDADGSEHVDGGTSRFNKDGVIYQAICGGCGAGGGTTMPTTATSYSPKNGSSNCNLAALKMEFNLGAVNAIAQARPDATVCLGDPVQFENTSSNASSYEWLFGDGNASSTLPNPIYMYTRVGTYSVRMIAVNPNACKVRDTVTLTIRVDTMRIKADFNIQNVQNCPPFKATFLNTSTFSKTPGSTTYTKFFWDFGDNTTYNGVQPPEHIFANAGTYTVTMVMIDSTACNSPDTIRKMLQLSSDSVMAILDVPDLVCTKTPIAFGNRSRKALRYLWTFGDGDSSTSTAGIHQYDSIGTYTIKLFAINETSCNKIDSVEKTFTVMAGPTAEFFFAPIDGELNQPTTFTNMSTGAVKYQWDFGDYTGSSEHSPAPKQYKRTGKYTVCLVVASLEGCVDTVCKLVPADVQPLADVPTAFSPNGDGKNDILFVYGYAIDKMTFRIYNRWGKKIFESKDQAIGWDGTYNGAGQDVEAYAYTLNITFIDGTVLNKKGNVTLIR
ncbi:MAG: PKD domain-containing protein [Sphingobacteriales bacterium]|nr:MAG: PKD domain-containing protein [Sphingobacteriales bacterium]